MSLSMLQKVQIYPRNGEHLSISIPKEEKELKRCENRPQTGR